MGEKSDFTIENFDKGFNSLLKRILTTRLDKYFKYAEEEQKKEARNKIKSLAEKIINRAHRELESGKIPNYDYEQFYDIDDYDKFVDTFKW